MSTDILRKRRKSKYSLDAEMVTPNSKGVPITPSLKKWDYWNIDSQDELTPQPPLQRTHSIDKLKKKNKNRSLKKQKILMLFLILSKRKEEKRLLRRLLQSGKERLTSKTKKRMNSRNLKEESQNSLKMNRIRLVSI